HPSVDVTNAALLPQLRPRSEVEVVLRALGGDIALQLGVPVVARRQLDVVLRARVGGVVLGGQRDDDLVLADHRAGGRFAVAGGQGVAPGPVGVADGRRPGFAEVRAGQRVELDGRVGERVAVQRDLGGNGGRLVGRAVPAR